MKGKDTKRASRIHAQQLPDDLLIECQRCIFIDGCEEVWPRCINGGGQNDGEGDN